MGVGQNSSPNPRRYATHSAGTLFVTELAPTWHPTDRALWGRQTPEIWRSVLSEPLAREMGEQRDFMDRSSLEHFAEKHENQNCPAVVVGWMEQLGLEFVSCVPSKPQEIVNRVRVSAKLAFRQERSLKIVPKSNRVGPLLLGEWQYPTENSDAETKCD